MTKKIKSKPYMEQAIELAKRGFSTVEPNPMVGAVIFNDEGKILGQGWHKEYGGPHAEVNAIANCKANGHSTINATMCVTLEPCCHHGKTPPCTDAIINAGITKVVIAMTDPSDKVSGQGIAKLQEHNIKVTTGTCEKEAFLLNPAFIKYSLTKTPWVILKWAQTIDGKLAGNNEQLKQISSESSIKDVHKLRRSAQAILVGIETVINDDPTLTPRPDKGTKLIRCILDTNLRTPLDSKLMKTTSESPVFIFTSKETDSKLINKFTEAGAKVSQISSDKDTKLNLKEVLTILGKHEVQKLIVEGGAKIHQSFIEQKLADQATIYIAPKIYGPCGTTDISNKLNALTDMPQLYYTSAQLFDDNTKITGFFKRTHQFDK